MLGVAELVVEETFFDHLANTPNSPNSAKLFRQCIDAPWLLYAGNFSKLSNEVYLDNFEHIMQTRARNYSPTIIVTSSSIEILPHLVSSTTTFMIRELRYLQSFSNSRKLFTGNLKENIHSNKTLVVA
jgi:hypothetical protein